MGASTDFRIYKASLGLAEIKKQWAAAVKESLYQDGHSYSGTIGMLGERVKDWYDHNYDTIERVYEFIEKTHEKWEGAMAVSCQHDGEKWWVIGGWCSS